MRILLLSLLLIGMGTRPAVAQALTPVSQDRRVLANSFDFNSPIPGNDSQEAIAPDFAIFDRTLTSQYFQGHGSASQHSEILTTLLHGSGDATGGGSSFDNGGGGTSRFDLTFALNEPTGFTLSGELVAQSLFSFATATAYVTLDGAIVESVANLETSPFAVGGTLAAGVHRLQLESVAASPPGPGSVRASYDFELALVPEPGMAFIWLAAGLFAGRRFMERQRYQDEGRGTLAEPTGTTARFARSGVSR